LQVIETTPTKKPKQYTGIEAPQGSGYQFARHTGFGPPIVFFCETGAMQGVTNFSWSAAHLYLLYRQLEMANPSVPASPAE